MSESEVNQLIRKSVDQDRGAQKALYKTFYGFAKAICLRYSNNNNEASEILNKGFLKVFRNLHRYTCQDPFKSWLAKIMVNTSIDHYRVILKILLIKDIEYADVVNDEIRAESKLNYDDLLAIVQQLPPGYRVVFNMFAIDGYSHNEISKMLNIDTQTSKSNLSGARIKLKEMILKTDNK